MRKAARFLIVIFIILGLGFSFLNFKSTVLAQIINSHSTPLNNPDVPRNLHTYSQSVLIEVMSAVSCQLTGIDPINPNQRCLGIDLKTNKIGFVENNSGLIGTMADLISTTLYPPLHFSDYSTYLAGNFGIAKSTYAADCKNGVGYCTLSPMIKIWSVFRDFAYYILVIVFVFIGMAIIVRVKIDPRTVMTIQNQIPKIILAIVFITLSFAIAGILIDLMWLIIYLILNLFQRADPNLDVPRITSNLTADPFNFLNNIFIGTWVPGWGLAKIAHYAADSVKDIVKDMLDFGGTSGWGWLNPLNWIKEGIAHVFGFVFGILAFLIFSLAIIITLFRIWFMLLMAYVSIVIDVIFAPLWIVAGILPGSSGKRGFSGWLRHISAKILVFPTVVVMFLIAKLFIDILRQGHGTYTTSLPIIGLSSGPEAAAGLISLGVLFMTPQAAKWIDGAFKALTVDLAPIGSAIGSGTRPLSSGAKVGWNRMWNRGDPYFRRPAGWLRQRVYFAGTNFNEETGTYTPRAGVRGFIGRTVGKAAHLMGGPIIDSRGNTTGPR